MRIRATTSSLMALVLVFILAAPAMASKPTEGCPAAVSGWVRVDGEGWSAGTVAGILEEGLTVEGEAERFGFGDDLGSFKAFVIAGALSLDRNANGFICMKDVPNTPGHPGFIFGAVDDMASAGG